MAVLSPEGSLTLDWTIAGGPGRQRTGIPGDVTVVAAVAGDPIRTELLAGAGFEVRVHDTITGALLAVVPRPEHVDFEDVLSDVGSGKVVVATSDVPATVFARDHIWRILWEGAERFAFRGEMVEDVTVTDDEVRRRTVTGRGLAHDLETAIVYPLGLGTDAPIANRPFSATTRAGIVGTLLAEAHARGAAPGISAAAWTSSRDSQGVAWTDTNALEVAAGTSLLQLVTDYGDLTWDWHVDPDGGLRLAQHLGTDRSGQVVLHPAGSVVEATATTDRRTLADVVLVEDGNGGFTEQVDATALAAWGRKEQFANAADAVDQASRANVGYRLLQLWKSEHIERLVKVATTQAGRRPFVDFGLGDTVAVEFTDGTVLLSRVIAIALAGGPNGDSCEVTLDFMLEQRHRSGGTSSSATPATPTDQIIFGDNGNAALTVDTSARIAIDLLVQAFQATSARCKTYLRCVASSACTITAEVVFDGSVIRTMKHPMAAGADDSWAPEFLITSLPAGSKHLWLRLSVSAGTLTVQPFDLQFWLEGKYLGGAVSIPPQITISDTISGAYPSVTTTVPTAALQTPLGPSSTDSVSTYPATVSTSMPVTGATVERGYLVAVAAGADDGETSNGPSFSASATQSEVGNDGGTVWHSFYRFVLPASIPAGATITYARLRATGDQTDTGALTTLAADLQASSPAPTTRADFLGRTPTTAAVNWDTAVTSGAALTSPDLAAVVQELVTAYGTGLTAITLLHTDRSSPTNGKMVVRTKDNAANQPPTLEVRWTV